MVARLVLLASGLLTFILPTDPVRVTGRAHADAPGLHAPAALLIPRVPFGRLWAGGLQLLVAHEMGHEYVWMERVAVSIEGLGHSPVSPIVVPFERAPWPYIVIRVPVAGAPSEAMIFDTGTSTTVLVPALATRLGLSAGHAAAIESLNGSERGIKGEAHGIGFDGVPARGPKTAIVTNIAGLRGFTPSIAGIYGHNWLTGTDYLIDYDAKRIVMGAPGTLPGSTGGHRTALTWSAGRPAVPATVRAHMVAPFSARVVLDSGADHVTLFGTAAERMTLVADRDRTMFIDTGFGTREVPTAVVSVRVGGRERAVLVELRNDIRDREEEGLVPTSFFRSVLVSATDGVVVFDARMSLLERR